MQHIESASVRYGGREGHFRLRNADSKIGTTHREIDTADQDLSPAQLDGKKVNYVVTTAVVFFFWEAATLSFYVQNCF